MSKQEFLDAVRAQLRGLPKADLEQSLQYYGEMVDDRMEDGMTEAEAVAAMDTPEEIGRQVLAEMPLAKVVKARVTPKRRLRAWELVLLVLGSPLWFPLVLTAALLALTAYLLIWVAVALLYCCDACLFAAALTGAVCCGMYGYLARVPQAAVALGVGLAAFGLGVALLFAFNRAAAALAGCSRRFVLWIKAKLAGKGTEA